MTIDDIITGTKENFGGRKRMNEWYIVTSVQSGAAIKKEVADSIELMAQDLNAKKIMYQLSGKSVRDDELTRSVYERLNNGWDLQTKPFYFNKNIMAKNYNLRPQMLKPLTGLPRLAKDDVSTIIPHPKQNLKTIANLSHKHPKVIMTTGTITSPNYNLNNRIGQLAKDDTVYGGVLVNITSPSEYNFYQFRSLGNGKINFGGKQYFKGKVTESRVEAMILGDLHTGDTDPVALKETYRQMTVLNPKRIYVHDFFNGHSINHHTRKNLTVRSMLYKKNGLSLERELRDNAERLKDIVNHAPKDAKIYFVASNHNEWINQWVDDGTFMHEPMNSKIGAELYIARLEGQNTLAYGINKFYNFDKKQVKFLSRNDSSKVKGYELGMHGDQGANGARGSNKSSEENSTKNMIAHRHTMDIFRDCYTVPTLTYLDCGYNKGLSSWIQGNGVIYENGKAGLFPIIDGRSIL